MDWWYLILFWFECFMALYAKADFCQLYSLVKLVLYVFGRVGELVSDLNKSLCGKKCILTFEIVALVY